MFDPNHLAGIPAPFWLIQFLKVLGFVLHLIPMGLWAVALPLAVLGSVASPGPFQRFGRRVLQQMPIFIALGINFGIVPLLFIQTLYPKPFYTATILVAWHWIVIIPLLMIGYYGVYLTSFAIQSDHLSFRRCVLPVGLVSSCCFLAIGLLLTNALTLIAHPERWIMLFEKTQIAGAVNGFGNNMSDPTFLPRLLAMFSLALVTTGLWAMTDAFLFADGTKDENRPYRRWALRFALLLACPAFILQLLLEGSAKFGPLAGRLGADYPCFGWVLLLCLLLTAFLFYLRKRDDYTTRELGFILALHLGMLATFGAIRQIGQHRQLAASGGLIDMSEQVQWSPIILFLITFVFGLLCIAWIVRQLVLAKPADTAESP